MYESYYGLSRRPFELSPDPQFLFPTESTREALAALYHSVCDRKGIAVMTGEVGTGKTLVIQCLLESLRRHQFPFSYVFNPRLSSLDFLRYVAFDLGVECTDATKGGILHALYRFVLAQSEKGQTTVLVVDEAHQLSASVLEEVRLFSNIETTKHKLIQVVLAGQPELDAKLDSQQLRQLKQRITVRCVLEPLRANEARDYIMNRLVLAGCKEGAIIFSNEVIASIHRLSGGVPRLMNTFCDHALTIAFSRDRRTITSDIVEEVADCFKLRSSTEGVVAEKISVLGESKARANQSRPFTGFGDRQLPTI